MTRLFHVSDLHFGMEDPRAIQWFKSCVAEERPDAVAITGDLTMRARSGQFAAACAWIQSLDVPITCEIGNHDLSYYNPFERFIWPYRRFGRIERLIERELDIPGLSLVPLKTTARAQWRTNWSRGWVTSKALRKTLDALAALPPSQTVIVCCHHPLVEAGTRGEALTRGGEEALAALAGAGVSAVLSGHVHDAFDLVKETPNGPIRMIGAGTLSLRIRSTPPSFNELHIDEAGIEVKVRNLEALPTPDMQIDDVPPDAVPPKPGEPTAPAAGMSPVAAAAVADGRDMEEVLPEDRKDEEAAKS
jgi:predicted phosphodiesterase